jgi:hypothetical protein
MRIVIDIDGDQVRVHRLVGDESPPADIIARAAALNAESAGIAMLPGGVTAIAAIGVEPADAGRAPSSAGAAGKTTRSSGSKPTSRRRAVSKSKALRRARR